MYYSSVTEEKILVRLEKGEEVISSIHLFCNEKKIFNAFFWGIGSCENPTLAHYSVKTKKYSEKSFSGIFEITNIIGNVAVFENNPLVHAHITLSDESMQSLAGHLVKTHVSATAEIYLEKFPSQFIKKFNEKIGLKLFDLPKVITSNKR